MRSFTLYVAIMLLVGCGSGGSTTSPDGGGTPRIKIDGIRPSQHLSTDAPGYAGDELTIEVLTSGETPTSIVWDFGGGAIPFGDDHAHQQVELGVPGSFTGRVTVYANGHSDTYAFPYKIVPELERLQGISPTSPAGFVTQPIHFIAQVDGEVEVATWTFLDGGATPTIATDVSPVVQLGEPGEHQVKVQVTLKQGPTITRTFPFTVIANPWQERLHLPEYRFHQSLVLSDGGIAVLVMDQGTHFNAEGLVLLLAEATEAGHPESWSHHDFGLTNRNQNTPVLVEHQGHLGIGAVELEQFPWGNKNYPVQWTSSNLHPARPADWTRSIVGWTNQASSIGLAGNPGGGWLMAIAAERSTFWGATASAVPDSNDWIVGAMETFQNGPYPQFQLATFEGALVLSNPRFESMTRVQVGQPANFEALLSGVDYELPGSAVEMRRSGDRLIALLVEDETDELRIAHAGHVPLSLSDWTIDDMGIEARTNDDLHVYVEGDTLYAVLQEFFLSDLDIKALRFRSRPLMDPAAAWTTEVVTADDWVSPFVIPTVGAPLVGWTDTLSPNQLVIASKATP